MNEDQEKAFQKFLTDNGLSIRDIRERCEELERALYLVWSANDIYSFVDTGDYSMGAFSDVDRLRIGLLKDAETREILKTVARQHDASYGVTWDTLEDAIRTHLRMNP